MQKKSLKITAATLAASTLFTGALFGGCGKKVGELIKDPNVLRLYLWSGGYGAEWAEKLKSGFETKYPEYTVDVNSTPVRDKISVEAEAAPADNKYDILFSDNEMFKTAYNEYTIPGVQNAFAEISDVFNEVSEKMFAGASTYISEPNGGKNYILPVLSTMSGIVYNKEIFADCGLTHEPRTTDELLEYCAIIKEKGYVPFIFAGDTDYYTPTTLDWWIQYQGWEEHKNYCYGMARVDGDLIYSPEIFKQNGRLYAMETMEKLIGYDGDSPRFTDGKCTGYLFMDAQRKFIAKENGKYKYAMMANGAWLENEMKKFVTPGETPLDLMTTPLISDIVYNETAKKKDAQSPVTTDAVLRELVDYVRGNRAEKPAGVSDSFIERVREAVMRSRSDLGFNAVIPSASKKTELAKKFLKYLYSDEGIEAVAQSRCGAYVPVNYDYESVENLYSSLTNVQKKAASFFKAEYKKNYLLRSHPIVYTGGLPLLANKGLYSAFAASNPADRKSAQTLFNEILEYYSAGNAWSDLLTLSGLGD